MKHFRLRIADCGLAVITAFVFMITFGFAAPASAMLTAKANHDHITIDFFYHGSTVSVKGNLGAGNGPGHQDNLS